MARAIISDIHSNLEALEAVLQDIRARGIKDVICLGDVVGYGPNPRECLDLAMGFSICLQGNHDEAILFPPDDFNLRADKALSWTRDQLLVDPIEPNLVERRLAFLQHLLPIKQEGQITWSHGSPRRPLREYVAPKDTEDKAKMREIFDRINRYCFIGHSHIPGVYTPDFKFIPPSDLLMGICVLDQKKALINVGSVGQPRDGDARACYVTFDGDSVVFRRVQYDVETVRNKIHKIPGLPNSLGDRLLEGK